MYAVTSTCEESFTRATLRSAEFGFLGVVVYTRVHTPRRWGEPLSAGVLVFSTLSSRPLRTSWLIVGMGGLDLLPALGRALECAARLGGARFRNPPAPDRPTHAVGRVALPGAGRIVRTGIPCPSRLGASGDPGAPR